MNKYDDIINLPHHVSKNRPRMTLYNRAAQFAPFAALTGYGDEVEETARLTERKIIIDDGLREILSNKLNIINDNLEDKHIVKVTYFIKDSKKDGGKYVVHEGVIRRIDEVNEIIYFIDRKKIKFDDILNITSETLKFE